MCRIQPAKEEHPNVVDATTWTKETALLSDWGGVVNDGPVAHGPIRLSDLHRIASRTATRPLKVSVGAGPAHLARHVYVKHYPGPPELSSALCPTVKCQLK